MNSKTLGSFALILAFCLRASIAQTTQPADDGPPVPVAVAPSYIAIGKDIAMRLDLVRENVAELTLDDATRAQANALIDGVSKEVNTLITAMQTGPMPGTQRVLGIPGKLKAARQQLTQTIGPDRARILQTKLESIRGEARYHLGQLRNMLGDLKLNGSAQAQTKTILADARHKTSDLPDTRVDGDAETKSRDAMNHLLGSTHDAIAALLSPEQQQQLGYKFSQLAYVEPATRP